MRESSYYSVRMGINQMGIKIDFELASRLFFNQYNIFLSGGYFSEYFGYKCVDGDVDGKLGPDIETAFFLKLRKKDLWPFNTADRSYSEDDLFDIIEFTYDCVSKPLNKTYHGYYQCGYHYNVFDRSMGQQEFRKEVNLILKDYLSGYELSEGGQILTLLDTGFGNLLSAEIPLQDGEIRLKVNHALHKFRNSKSSLQDRRDAIRELADILEYLRPQAEKILTKKDDSDLFNIANNFGIRHHNRLQQDQYNKPIWYSWLFYFYLATIHAVTRFIEEDEKNS